MELMTETLEKPLDSNYFEELVDKMVLDEIPGINQEFINVINGLPRSQKRMAILSILDKDLNLFRRIKALTNQNINKMEHIKDIILMLREYVKVGDVEKKKFGEVMTPLELVKKMLSTLPEEVWSDPNLKWLDPANGTGPFPLMVIYKLMIGLKDWEPDDEKRYKHIVENMIYVCEIQPKNMFLYMCAVDPFDKYNLNIYTGSFLEEGFDKHMRKVWGVDKFDISLGNPPFNSPINILTSQGTTGNFIWDKFVLKSLDSTSSNKFLLFVHPPGWRRPPSDKSKNKVIWDKISKKQIIYLEIHDVKDGKKTFGAGTRYDFYLLQNTPSFKKTIIKDEEGIISEIFLGDWPFIPNKFFNLCNSIINKGDDEPCKILYNRSNYGADRPHISRVKTESFKYEIVHSTPKSGNRLVFSKFNNRGHFGVSKIIFGESGINDVIIDLNGNYGMSQGAMAICVNSLDEAINLKKALTSDKFKLFLKSVLWSNFRIEWKLFSYLKSDFWKSFI